MFHSVISRFWSKFFFKWIITEGQYWFMAFYGGGQTDVMIIIIMIISSSIISTSITTITSAKEAI